MTLTRFCHLVLNEDGTDKTMVMGQPHLHFKWRPEQRDLSKICTCIRDDWQLENEFKKCCASNFMDGSENDMQWAEQGTEETLKPGDSNGVHSDDANTGTPHKVIDWMKVASVDEVDWLCDI